MSLRDTTDDENNVGTWKHGHGSLFSEEDNMPRP